MSNNENVLRQVFDTLTIGIFVVDVEWIGSEPKELVFRFITNNFAYAQMLSLAQTNLSGLQPHECFPPDIANQFCNNYKRCLKQQQPISYEESLGLANQQCTLLTTLLPIVAIDGKISRIIGSSQDVTARKQVNEAQKQAEKALSQERELLSTLIKNVPVGIISTDELGKVLFVNPAYEKICGYSSEELVGRSPPYPYWDLADLETINHEFRLAMSGEKKHIELWFTRKNGERFLARLQPITIFDDQGNMLRHLATMEDITQSKRVEEELSKALEIERELNQLKSRFINMVSHEYRTPLTTILSSAELLERYTHKFTEDNKLKHYQRIQTTAKVLTQLVNDVLTLNKIEAGKQEFNPSPINLGEFCQELIEDLQLTLGSQHNLVFTSQDYNTLTAQQLDGTNPPYIDERLLRYIISNLLSNAIKYSPRDSTIEFNLTCNQNKA
ncbi:MAG TPA: PAS domain S-box protein, partial [Cyanophyceae cyanobacterium]